MASQVQVLLNSFSAALQRIQACYERDLPLHVLSDELLRDIRHLIGDLRSALDWTATDLDRKYGSGKNRSPYFPLRADSADFAGMMSKDFPNVPQNVSAAVERHQPYTTGRAELAHLPQLSRVNGHQGFTEQNRTEQRRWQQGGVSWGEGVSWSPGSVFVGGNPMGHPEFTSETVLVGWNFADPPLPVIWLLAELARLVTDAVTDIRHEAGL